MIRFLQHVPLLLFVLIFYNLIAFTAPGLVYEKPEVYSEATETEPVSPETDASTVDISETAADSEASKAIVDAAKNIEKTGQKGMPLPSGARLTLTFADFILLVAIILLYFELFKSTHTGNSAIVEHVFSILVFLVFLIEFIVVEPCGTSTFLLITLLSFIDVAAGLTITISTARRDFGVGAHSVVG